MANIRLYQFPAKIAPVAADIVYIGDSASAFNEVYSTIAQLANAITTMTGLTGSLQAPSAITGSGGINILGFNYVGSAANAFDLFQATTGNAPQLTAVGSDTNIGMIIATKGTGTVVISTPSGSVPLSLNANGSSHNILFSVPSLTGDRTITLRDVSGTIAYLSDIPSSGTPLALNAGGTNADLTASAGSLVYSTASAMAFTAVGSSGQLMISQGTSAPIWTTSTYPTTNAANTLLYASSANTMAALATANNGVLITSAGGVPSISSTLPSAVQTNITALGTQAQALNMNSHQINNVSDPSSAQDAATKNYVDTIATGGGAPVVAATTGALTVTQAGAGVGATLTNAGAQAAFSIDGQSPTVGQRVLIKNQASNTQNGVYIVTVVGTGATNWVLTRAIDYDTPSDINGTGIIPVSNGTVNANSGWVNTTLMVTVDTTAITFIQFAISIPSITMTQKLGSGGGNYTTTSTSYVDMDGTNLAYTVTIPIGYKLHVVASMSVGNSSNQAGCIVCIADSTTTLVQNESNFNLTAAANSTYPLSLNTIINGDGNSHTVKLRFATPNTGTAFAQNSSATLTPMMTFILCPSS